MRQRKLKNLKERLWQFSTGEIIEPQIMKGQWQSLFSCNQPLYLELGCGKGQFITSLAKAYPDRNFIAVEGQQSVILRAMEKCTGRLSTVEETMENVPEELTSSAELQDNVYPILSNLVFVNAFFRDVTAYFEEQELDGIYLNFSDPWPKDRHAKRRLTHRGFLNGYGKILKPEGTIQFKTDNDDLFAFSISEIKAANFEILEITEDLHKSDLDAKAYRTEYEDKFSGAGKNINYCKICGGRKDIGDNFSASEICGLK